MTDQHKNEETIPLTGKADDAAPTDNKANPEWYMELLSYIPKAIYEFVGIFFFVCTIYFTSGDVNKFIFGFWVILTFFGSYSGAHVNPAITFGCYIYDGKWFLGIIKLLLYWTAHIFGAGLAAKFSYYVTHKEIFVALPAASNTFEVFFSEFMFTGTFLFVILFVCSDITGPQIGSTPMKTALIVGWFYCAVHMGSHLSGAAYNPAILLALNSFEYFLGNVKALNKIWYMVGAEFLGALVFALCFKYIFERNFAAMNKIQVK